MQQEQIKSLVLAPQSRKEIAVVDEHGNTVGMLVSHYQSPNTVSSREMGLHLRYPLPCSKQASISTNWLKQNFEENVLTSVPRSVMFEHYCAYCRQSAIKPFNQAVFGKVVRSCFPNLTTRRLGIRGQSRYHYAGLCVKATSHYAPKFRVAGERLNVLRASSNRRREVAANVTIDGTEDTTMKGLIPMVCDPPSSAKTVSSSSSSLASFIPHYPRGEELILPPGCSQRAVSVFITFYSSFNQNLSLHIIGLDFQATLRHLKSFASSIPQECSELMGNPQICNIITLCDDIMYQEATDALLPNCLETLTTEFNVLVRKFAKSMPLWMEETSSSSPECDVTKARVGAARSWSESVRRVTTLCHVAREARKTLRDPAIASQLLYDLTHMNMNDIVDQCTFATQTSNKKMNRAKLMKIRDEAMCHVSHVCKLLKHQSPVEAYAAHVDRIVAKCAGLRPEAKLGEEASRSRKSQQHCVVTEKTRQFVMTWATYSSKMLTEITLKSSESVGTFHLILLLFGDYVNHVILVRQQRAKRVQLLNSVIKKGSGYFRDLRASQQANGGQGLRGNPPGVRRDGFTRMLQVQCKSEPQLATLIAKEFNQQQQQQTDQQQEANLYEQQLDKEDLNEPAVLVEPAYCSSDSFLLYPADHSVHGAAVLCKKS